MPDTRMSPEVKASMWEWGSGFVIGLLPLLAHASLYPIITPPSDFNELWSPDVLFISIGNSGLSVVTVFARLIKGTVRNLDVKTGVLMACTVIILALTCATYGAIVNGKPGPYAIDFAIIYLVCSAVCSLFFEVAIAGRMALRP